MVVLKLVAAFACLAAASPAPWTANLARDGRVLQSRQSGPDYPANTIDMPIDHYQNKQQYAPHTNATFKQRYFFDDSYYKPGGPIFLYIGGETSGESRFSNLQTGIIQILMQQFNGLGVILENRWYGKSFPFNTSTTDNMRFMTTEQTIADNRYFAQNVKFPGVNGSINAPGTPWILYGGSLAGAQTAFSIKAHGDVLYGGIAASAPVQPSIAYPEWYNPIQTYAPQDCVASINNIVANFDSLVAAKRWDAVQQFKEIFGLGKLKDIRDFAQVIAWPLGGPLNYPTNTWQELGWGDTGSQDFWYFCRNVTNMHAPANTTAVDRQLSNYTNGQPWTNLGNYAAYVKRVILPGCPSGDYDSTSCFGTQNQSYWADPTNNEGRSYMYTTCVEQGAWQVAPRLGPTLISRVLQTDYTQQWCNWSFPPGKYNKIPALPDLSYYSSFGGINIKADRLALIDGSSDVWRELTYHASYAQYPRPYSDLSPAYLIEGAGHHWDSYGIKDVPAEPQYIREAHYWEIRIIERWLQDFGSWKKSKRSSQ